MSSRKGIPGAQKKTFGHVGGGVPSEHHVIVNGNVNDDVNDNRYFEHLHSRHTVWLNNDLARILDRHVLRKGDKTEILNDALRQYFHSKGWVDDG